MTRILHHLRANVIAYLALFIALGGTSYAFTLPAGSVGSRELKNHSITPIKFDPRSIAAYVRAWAVIKNGNHVVSSRPKARVVGWDPSFGAGVVSWGHAIQRACFPVASGGTDLIQVAILPGAHHTYQVHIGYYTSNGQLDPSPVVGYVAVMCPGQ